MANKKISQLSATTESNDNVWLIMNNSGNTETFRIKRSDLLSGTSQPQTIEISGFTDTNGNNFTTTNDVFPSQPNTFNTSVAGRGFINYGYNNSVGSNAYIFGSDNTAGNNYEFGGMIIGQGNTFTTDAMIIGRDNTDGRGFVFGRANTGSGNNYRNLKLGTNNNSSSQQSSTIGYYNLNDGSISFLGGSNNKINSGTYNTIVSNLSQITTNSQKNSIFGGYDSDITSTEDNNTILNCEGSVISGTTSGTTLIGLTNFKSPTNDNTTYVDNIHTLRTETFDTISGGSVSGVVSVDLSLGTIYKFSITGNITSVDFTNWREGQRVEFIVENTASYTISAMTITGGGQIYTKGGTVNPTNNAFTKYKGVIVDGDMFLNEELNFQPFV